MNLLKETFSIKNISADMTDILGYEWSSIYTTNYDDAIELALKNAGKNCETFNNTDAVPKSFTALPVIHLHGAKEKWTIENFKNSCVLTADSYLGTDRLSGWLDQLQSDVERAQVVVYVGFSTEDLHLNQILYNIAEIKTKTWFVNRRTAAPDMDQHLGQSRFGEPLYIGRAGLALQLNEIVSSDAPNEPALVSFRRFEPAQAATEVPSPDSIENLFIFGEVIPEQVARDVSVSTSDFHLLRSVTRHVQAAIADGKRVILLTGEICDGKTLALAELSYRLSITRPVFNLEHAYEDITDEAARILGFYPDAVLIIENCFHLQNQRRVHLTKLVSGSEATLIMSARSISVEAETAEYREMSTLPDFVPVRTGLLDDTEIDNLIKLTDQIAGWRHLNNADSHQAKQNYIVKTCGRSLPNFLLSLLRSGYVREKYQEEFNKVGVLAQAERSAVIIALYASRIGYDAPVSFLSNTNHIDAGALIQRLSGKGNASHIRFFRLVGARVTTIPSIGAINLLSTLFSAKEVVESVIRVLEHLTRTGHYEDFENTMFQQMMRYSILRSVVDDRAQIERFFSHISKIRHCQEQVLFWVQWHMAETDAGNFVNAEKYLEEGYRRASARERYSQREFNRDHLDDRKAKFLMLRLSATARAPAQAFRDFQEALVTTQKLLRRDATTKHPFQTLLQVARTFREKGALLEEGQRIVVRKGLQSTLELAERRREAVQKGHHSGDAERALNLVADLLGANP